MISCSIKGLIQDEQIKKKWGRYYLHSPPILYDYYELRTQGLGKINNVL